MAPRFPVVPGPGLIIARRAMVNGVFGSSRFWRTIAVVILTRRALRKLMGSDPHTVAVEQVRPGETIILRGVTRRHVPSR